MNTTRIARVAAETSSALAAAILDLSGGAPGLDVPARGRRDSPGPLPAYSFPALLVLLEGIRGLPLARFRLELSLRELSSRDASSSGVGYWGSISISV